MQVTYCERDKNIIWYAGQPSTYRQDEDCDDQYFVDGLESSEVEVFWFSTENRKYPEMAWS